MSDAKQTNPSTPAAPAGNGSAASGAGRAGGLDYAPPPPPSRLRRTMTGVRRWARDTFSREQLVSGLKQLAWVAPLTVLIWVYADREQQDTFRDMRFRVELRTNSPKQYVRLAEPSDGYVSLDLTGAKAQLEDLRNAMGRQASPIRFEVSERKEGEYQIPISAVLNRDDRFNGLTLPKSEPSHILVVVDRFEDVLLDVQMREEDKALFGPPVFNPPKVRVSMPKAERLAAEKVAPGGKLVAYADLATLPDQTPGKKIEASNVRVTVPHANPEVLSIEPGTVSASLVVRERAKTYTFESLTVLESVPTRLRDTAKVEINPVNLFNVVISGPPEVIDRIAANNGAGVMAHVTIGPDDVDKGPLTKKPWFSLPEGVRVVSYQGEDQGLRVTVSDVGPR